MKRKMVIKVPWMTNQNSRNKVLQYVAGFPGVESVALAGNDQREIVAIGEGLDAVKLMTLMRKKFTRPFCWLKNNKMGTAELETLGPVAEDKKKDPQPPVLTQASAWSGGGSSIHYCVVYDHDPCICSIL